MAIRPASGLANPATQSSRVVLPAPDGPNRIVNPGAARNSASRINSRACAANRLLILASSSAPIIVPRAETVDATATAAGSSVREALIAESFYRAHEPGFPIDAIYDGQHDEAECEQQQGGLIGGGI